MIDRLESAFDRTNRQTPAADRLDWEFEDAEFGEGEARIYFSCRDTRRFFSAISEELFPSQSQCVLRFGHYLDPECTEEFVNFGR
ncbi:hypothetical protein CGZ80_16920 [Rhodopirellula sp. MGV]|nr:hypothetical protein CGZ80_16920 [Rhodopirellula sp. MGV]